MVIRTPIKLFTDATNDGIPQVPVNLHAATMQTTTLSEGHPSEPHNQDHSNKTLSKFLESGSHQGSTNVMERIWSKDSPEPESFWCHFIASIQQHSCFLSIPFFGHVKKRILVKVKIFFQITSWVGKTSVSYESWSVWGGRHSHKKRVLRWLLMEERDNLSLKAICTFIQQQMESGSRVLEFSQRVPVSLRSFTPGTVFWLNILARRDTKFQVFLIHRGDQVSVHLPDWALT